METEIISNDEKGMAFAKQITGKSKCIKKHVGAVILNPFKGEILSYGYNTTPWAKLDCTDQHLRSKIKNSGGTCKCRNLCMCAEERAILDAQRRGIGINGMTLYVTHLPCCGCAKMIVEAELGEVVVLNFNPKDEPLTIDIFAWYKICVRKYREEQPLNLREISTEVGFALIED